MNLNFHLQNSMAKCRIGLSNITTYYFHYWHPCVQDLICPSCEAAEEDEIHFVLCCEADLHLRVRDIHRTVLYFS